MGLSRESRIGLAVGIGSSILLLLIEPKQHIWRFILLGTFGASMVVIAKESDWVQQHTIDFSIIHPKVSRQIGVARLGIGVLLAVLFTIVIGVITWPEAPKPIPVAPAPTFTVLTVPAPVPLPLSTSSVPNIKPRSGTLVVPVEPKKKPTPKPTTAEPYPIVVATASQVTNHVDTKKINIQVTVGNGTVSEANAHISIQSFSHNADGTEPPTGEAEVRDIGLGPPPFTYEITREMETTADGEARYLGGTAYIVIVMTVSYQDRGGTTIYHFKGRTQPNLDHLDYLQSDWERVP